MEAYQERVIEEKKELDGRLDRLREFIHSSAMVVLEAEDQGLLNRQFNAMHSYSDILEQRISRFK
jgi:hypothetical protein